MIHRALNEINKMGEKILIRRKILMALKPIKTTLTGQGLLTRATRTNKSLVERQKITKKMTTKIKVRKRWKSLRGRVKSRP